MNALNQTATEAQTEAAEREINQRQRRLVEARQRLRDEQRALDADTIRHLTGYIVGLEKPPEEKRSRAVRYAKDVLGLSASMADSRVSAALVACKRPSTIDDYTSGRVTLTALRTIEPYIHFPKLLNSALGRTRREVEAIVSSHMELFSGAEQEEPSEEGSTEASHQPGCCAHCGQPTRAERERSSVFVVADYRQASEVPSPNRSSQKSDAEVRPEARFRTKASRMRPLKSKKNGRPSRKGRKRGRRK